jgi:hypothetical protein
MNHNIYILVIIALTKLMLMKDCKIITIDDAYTFDNLDYYFFNKNLK